MYQPDFPPVRSASGFTRGGQRGRGLNACCRRAYTRFQLRIKDKRDEEVEADVMAAIELGVAITPPVYQRLLAAGD
ncbi:hypothetical protein ACNKHK_26035 [Shigella flexneri]